SRPIKNLVSQSLVLRGKKDNTFSFLEQIVYKPLHLHQLIFLLLLDNHVMLMHLMQYKQKLLPSDVISLTLLLLRLFHLTDLHLYLDGSRCCKEGYVPLLSAFLHESTPSYSLTIFPFSYVIIRL